MFFVLVFVVAKKSMYGVVSDKDDFISIYIVVSVIIAC